MTSKKVQEQLAKARTTKKTRQAEFDAALDRAMAKDEPKVNMENPAPPAQYVPTEDHLVKELARIRLAIDEGLVRIATVLSALLKTAEPGPTFPPPPPGGFHPAPPAEVLEDPHEEPDEVVTPEDIHRALTTFVKTKGQAKAVALLGSFGGKKVSDLPSAKLPALLRALQA